MITFMPYFLGCIVVASLVVCKYIHGSAYFILSLVLCCYLLQKNNNKTSNKIYNYDDIIINMSQFIIISGIIGYIVVKIIGVFVSGFE